MNTKDFHKLFYNSERNDEAIENVITNLNSICEDIVKSDNKRRLVVIIGNGLQPQAFKRRDKLINSFAVSLGKNKEEIFEGLIWDEYENRRQVSSNILPVPAYALIFYLYLEAFSKIIITSNYDQFLNSIFNKNQIDFVLNPVDKEKIIDLRYTNNYYQSIKNLFSIIVWKYHGDTGFFSFPQCFCTFGLPSERTNFVNLCGDEVILSEIQEKIGCQNSHIIKEARHHIDFNYPETSRENIFDYEIKGTLKELEENSLSYSAIIVLGFTGRWDENNKDNRSSEEITPTLIKLAKGGFPIFMFLNPKDMADLNQSTLCKELLQINRNNVVEGSIDKNLAYIFNQVPLLQPALGYFYSWRDRGLFSNEDKE
jgi:hypothetical protein